jgi:exonuclease SbcC
VRPHRLELRAFGPFADRQVIDFSELGERAFFLVSGPTGAGKTSLLDAICFALYGESTGERRLADQLRSSQAKPDAECSVVFDFALGAERYRVARAPRQVRGKKRGTGTTEVPASATLWRRTACQSESEEGEPLETQPSGVTRRIETLLGFEAAQFRQVVVLPQGDFRRLLDADSRQREEILQRLFDVAHYQRVQDALKSGADGLRQEHEQRSRDRVGLLEQAQVASPAELDQGMAAISERLENAARSIADTQVRRGRARAELDAGRAASAKLDEALQSAAALAELGSEEQAFASRRQALQAARRAEPVLPLLAARRERQAEHARAAANAERASAERKGAGEAEVKARAALEAEQHREPEREAARREAARLETLRDVAASVAEQRAALGHAATRQAEARAVARKVVDALSEGRGQVESLGEECRRLEQGAAGLKAAQDLADGWSRRHERWQALVSVRARRDALDEEIGAAASSVEAAAAERSSAERHDAEVRHAARAGRALLLAAGLRPGEPCPVCGGLEHPQPAHAQAGSAAAPPDDAAVEAAHLALEASRRKLAEAEGAHAKLRDARGPLQGECAAHEQSLRRALPPDHAFLGDGAGEHIAREKALAEQALRDAQACALALAEQRAALDALRAKQAELEADESSARAALEKADSEHDRLQGQLDVKLSQLPDALRPPGALDEAIGEAVRLRDALVHGLEAAQRALHEAEKNAAARAAALREAEQSETAAAGALRDADAALEAGLGQAGFADADALEAARLEPAAQQALDEEIRGYDEALSRQRGLADAARAAAEGIAPPDLPALEAALSGAEVALSELQQSHGQLTGQLEQLARWRKAVREADAALGDLDARHRSLGQVARVANGDNPEKLTFQRFVLAAFLDEVLLLASRSLRQMSKGRYTLRRAGDVTDRRKGAGLDLVVEDAYTGDDRPVSTLSGGEGFLAALALALGLADVVQHHAGGIRLEAIFIDEGFGSLDPESLDDAVRTLLDLRSGGRMVGIISHVSELRERIDTRLEIRSDRGGSYARFELGAGGA